MSDLATLKAERDRLDVEHMQATDREGGCQRSMFLGDCEDCKRYYDLDDQIRDIEMGGTRTSAS